MTRYLTRKSGWRNQLPTSSSSVERLTTRPSWMDRWLSHIPSKPTLPTLRTSAATSLKTIGHATSSRLRRGPRPNGAGTDSAPEAQPAKPRSVPFLEIHTHRHPAGPVRWIKQVGGAAGVGAAAMYFLDPDRGPARRARVRDQAIRAQHELENGLDTLSGDLRNRATGLGAGVRYRITGRKVDDAVLVERVRAKLGLVAGHPRAIDVAASDGTVRLSGDVLAEEHRGLVRAVSRIPGVKSVDDHLRMHASADCVPGLQSSPPIDRRRPGPLQETWSPSTRLVGGAAGIGLLGAGRRMGGLSGLVVRGGGLAITARAAANKPLRQITGIGAGANAVEADASVIIDAPPEDVWPRVSNYTSFPNFMSNVRDVRRLPDDSMTRWTVRGPALADITFDAQETFRKEGQCLGWKTLPGQTVAHTGQIQVRDSGDGRSVVEVHMHYNPIAGEIGHGVAALLGSDARRRLREDLLQLRDLVEGRRADKAPATAPA
jgi:uncharacterized membrane protein